MQTRTIGNDTIGRIEVGAIGLGLMTFDQTGAQPREQLLDTVRAALDAGVTLFDTADAYGPGDELGAEAQGANETLVAGLLDELGVRDQVLLATKGGHVRTEGGGWDTDSTAAHLRAAVDASLGRLGVEQIALWQHHRPDPEVPYDDVIGTLKEIADSGKVARVGLSNADPDQIRAAHAVLGDALVSVQNQFSPAFRSSAPEIEVCEELGLAFLPWSPLGGSRRAPRSSPTSTRRSQRSPRRAASAPSRSRWPGSSPSRRWSSRSPAPSGRTSITDSAAAADLELSRRRAGRARRRRLTRGQFLRLSGEIPVLSRNS